MKRWQLTTLQWSLAVSVGVHALLLLVRFAAPEAYERIWQDSPLEVILVNARSRDAPDKAQAIAQASLAGGNDADDGRATSPLPPAPLTEVGDTPEQEPTRKLQALRLQQNLLLAQVKRQLASLAPQDPQQASATEEREAIEEKRRQLIQLLAEIERRIQAENVRPRKRYVSPAVREEAYALYYDHLRRAIELRGTEHFPEQGGKKLYGELTMLVTVNHDGRVLGTEVVVSSGNRTLDRRAAAIARAAGPFGKFTPAMRKQADQLVVVSRFRFSRDDALQTQVSVGQ